MDENGAYARSQLAGTESQDLPRVEPDVPYVELNVTALSAPRVPRDEGGLTSTYSEVYFPKDEHLINENEDPPIASGRRKLLNNSRTGPHRQQSKEKIGNRSCRKICLFCLVTSALIAIVVGLSIHVLQNHQSQITSDQNFQILCRFLTSKREQTCSQYWIRNEDRCYFISALETSYDGAKNYCSNIDASLLRINSKEEQNAVFDAIAHQYGSYWIGKCDAGKKASSLLFKHATVTSNCGSCDTHGWETHCNGQHRFICEKSAHSFTDIPEKIQDLCQQSPGPT